MRVLILQFNQQTKNSFESTRSSWSRMSEQSTFLSIWLSGLSNHMCFMSTSMFYLVLLHYYYVYLFMCFLTFLIIFYINLPVSLFVYLPISKLLSISFFSSFYLSIFHTHTPLKKDESKLSQLQLCWRLRMSQ